MQYTVIGSPHCCAFHIKHNLQSSIVSDTDRSSLWKREHDLGLVLRNIPVKGLQTIKRTCHILSARRVEFPYQLKVYEGSVFPEGVSFHHSFTANFSNVFNIFHENVYIWHKNEAFRAGVQPRGRVRAQHAGQHCTKKKKNKCNLRNEKLRPNTISFGTKDKTSYQSTSWRTVFLLNTRSYPCVCKCMRNTVAFTS